MNYQTLLESAQSLSAVERCMLISSLSELEDTISEKLPCPRLKKLLNKQACCPHCGGKHYYRYGKDKGSQRFKCKECCRTFTEYTGTWQERLHKKDLVDQYIMMMSEQKSLDKISATLHINKKTAFDWRHKILATLQQDEGDSLSGIVESDETFFEVSEKGNRHLKRGGRKRGRDPKKPRISDGQATVLVTADRNNGLNMTYCGNGRLTKKEIVDSLRKPLSADTILCSDGHVSYKGYANDNHLKHVVLRADLRQYVKKGGFHIQHINSLHNRLKKWIRNVFWGVATKYLQNYLNWFKVKETILKTAQDQAAELFNSSFAS